MGGNLGCHRSIPKDPTDFSNSKRKFSAACNFSHILVNQERLNINTATEEELMTLPGVNRTVAQNIVEYRNCIAGFKKVEDLALVSGIGAGKLEIIRLEICVSSRTGSSQHSPSSLRKDFEPHLSCTGMNINTATPAQLMSIRGITDKIAKNIVEYRMGNGPFKSIEDLVRVNHINSSLLDKIRFQVFVERSRTPSTNTNGGLAYTTKSHPSPTSFSLRSEDMELPPGGPTRIMSVRPNVEPPSGMRDGKAVVRVATWNLQNCSCEKANNPGVKEVVCMTLLENDIKLLAVQDLVDREALDKFCVELNQGSLDSVRKWRGPRGVWKSTVSEKPTGLSNKGVSYSGFLWDSSSGIDLKDASVLESPVVNGNGKHARPYLAHFYIGSSELTMVNVHMRAPAVSGAEESNVRNHHSEEVKAHRLTSSIQKALKVQKGLVVLGDFGLSPQSSELDQLRKERLSPLVPPNMFTNISTRFPQGSLCLDNIWVSKSLKKIYAGHCVVVREGLTNPWIPDNWSWGGVASDHCPVMAEFFVDVALKELRNRVAVVERGESMSKHER
ncbi:endonuclease/exonuclease/phosphatase family domain-containing protein 1-like isoform X2 [Salvelinus fontinalis]|uniref:endonuclease/exonuclease/phosphatase family domain-containing protein 1-like isoform X2 n=1 Tax=Salvelinus fontinalis TaxID=8038 RepID=UPI00248586A5|nr:endonuclease/exonuclease/phosphatase family domain-containing protein 1-like isoform X2 [Salvelinus fontinalis]